MVLFSTKFEDLPISQRVGDIIRVHRATVSEYKGAKHFTANLNYNAAWALFSPCPKSLAESVDMLGFLSDDQENKKEVPREFTPMQHFGKNYSPVEPMEQKLLKAMRQWVREIFSEK